VLGLQFHLEADSASLERWLVGHAYELGTRGIDITGFRQDAATHGAQLASRGRQVFAAWLSGLTFASARDPARARSALESPVIST
jgi:GMP synthase (glutamine-hydrolysing)